VILLLVACADDVGPPPDTGSPEEVAFDVCAEGVDASGEPTGVADCTDAVCEIPGGSFVMGRSDPATPDRCPARDVELDSFAMDRTEVTVEAWEACVTAGACAELPFCESEAPRIGEPSQVPASCVSWENALSYCEWVGGRLPTEAEWERAARGTEGTTYPWGEEPLDCDRANYHFVVDLCEGGPIDVGSYPGGDSPEGLADLAGNVFEWTADYYDAGGYADLDASNPTGAAEGTDRVLRGGAWNTRDEALDSTARAFGSPELQDANIGFRCVYGR